MKPGKVKKENPKKSKKVLLKQGNLSKKQQRGVRGIHSIKTRMVLISIAIVLCIDVGITGYAAINASSAVKKTASTTMQQLAVNAASLVEETVNEQKTIIKTVASLNDLRDDSLTREQKISSLSRVRKDNKYIKIGITDTKGSVLYSTGQTEDVSKEDYYKRAFNGETVVTQPMMSKSDKKIVVVIATPLKSSGDTIGVLIAVQDGDVISGIADKIAFGKTGSAFMLDGEGVKIAHKDQKLVEAQDNDLKKSKEEKEKLDPKLLVLEKNMIDQKSGQGEYEYNGSHSFMVYCPISGTDWSLAVTMGTSELYEQVNVFVLASVVVSVIVLLLAALALYAMSGSISKGIKRGVLYLNPIAQGDFSSEILNKHLAQKDEIGEILRAIDHMKTSIKSMILLVMENSKEISKDSDNLSSISQQMSASSNVMANSVSGVASGTIEQSEKLGNVSEELNNLSLYINQIIEEVNAVDVNAKDIKDLSGQSDAKMQSLVDSIDTMTQTFEDFENRITLLGERISKIHEITTLINGIAEQTNLLSLNASIEAARAGEAGRGFAVVADEIRKLADQTKDSSINIAQLIDTVSSENDVIISESKKVSSGFMDQKDVVFDVVNSFAKIVHAVEDIIPKIDSVTDSADQMIQKRETLIVQVKEVLTISEETSSSAEEIAASTEQMASSSEDIANAAMNLTDKTSQVLEEISKFRLTSEND